MEKITGIKVDVKKQTIEKCTLENSPEALCQSLNCRSIDCPTRIIAGMKLIVVCDDEFLLKELQNPAIIGISKSSGSFAEIILGNVFICKFNGVDDFASLKESEIQKLLADVRIVTDGQKKYKVLFSVFK